MTLAPVVLCGGSGSRLWPLSRALLPKQFLPLTGELSLLQETVQRLSHLDAAAADPIVVCHEAHRLLVAAQLGEFDAEPTVLLEPEGRNTAPAAAVAALWARKLHGESALVLVLPSDHFVAKAGALNDAVRSAIPAAEAGRLVTFGVRASAPETGYGYIRASTMDSGVARVDRFIEKPDLESARRFVESGSYLWNSGMFLFSADAFLAELESHAPAIAACGRKAVGDAKTGGAFVHLGREAFARCPSDSIDRAVMENTERASVVRLDAGWSDIGSWSSLHDVCARDEAGNASFGDVVGIDCRDSYLRSEGRLVTAVGLRGCVVIETKDAVLVAPRDRAQDVKKLVEALADRHREEVRLGREVFRPWGNYERLHPGDGYQVKRLTVLPGAGTSLQLHHQRSEHWVVVAGTARITHGDRVYELGKNEHVFLPAGTRHRIENTGAETVHIIEVQVGDYLGEDDIVRLEDRYGREGTTD